jgi:hypothetical protein
MILTGEPMPESYEADDLCRNEYPGEDFSVGDHSPEWYLQNGTWVEVHAALQQKSREQVKLLCKEKNHV